MSPDQIAFDCPHCGQKFRVPAGVAGQTLACPQCGGALRVPATNSPAEQPQGPGPKTPSWIFGLFLPLGLIGIAVHGGFIERELYIPAGGRPGREGFTAVGDAAVWGGIATIAMALALHAVFFWAPRPRFRTPAIIAFIVNLLACLAATAAAALI